MDSPISCHIWSTFYKNWVSCENKKCFVVGDFNRDCLKYQEKLEIHNFYNNIFERGDIPVINKPSRVTTKTAAIIDNIWTNLFFRFFDTTLIKGLIQSSVSDHFPI